MSYLANLFSAGNTEVVRSSLRRLMAVRWYRRSLELDIDALTVQRVLREAGLTPADADAIYRLTALATLEERYVLPPLQREEAIAGEGADMAEDCRQSCGFGKIDPPRRGA